MAFYNGIASFLCTHANKEDMLCLCHHYLLPVLLYEGFRITLLSYLVAITKCDEMLISKVFSPFCISIRFIIEAILLVGLNIDPIGLL